MMSWQTNRSNLLPIVLTVGAVLLSWHLLVMATGVPKFIFPAPAAVAKTFVAQHQTLLSNAAVTAVEIVIGLLIGTLLGVVSAILLTAFKSSRRWAFIFRWWLPPLMVCAIPTMRCWNLHAP